MNLPSLPNITELAPGLIRVLGQNPSSFTLQGTNLYLLRTHAPGRSVLLDTGSGDARVPALLQQAMRQQNITEFTHILLSHHHRDHVGGLKSLSHIIQQAHVCKYPDDSSESHWKKLADKERIPLSEEPELGEGLQIMHTPGHTADSICLLWYKARQLQGVFTADTVLGHGTSVFEDLGQYMASLHALEQLLESAPGPVPLYPGHGEVRADGLATVREYLKHRLDREKEVLQGLAQAPASLDLLLGRVYPQLPPDVVPAAKRGLQLQLDKLVNEGRVRALEDDRYAVCQGKL